MELRGLRWCLIISRNWACGLERCPIIRRWRMWKLKWCPSFKSYSDVQSLHAPVWCNHTNILRLMQNNCAKQNLQKQPFGLHIELKSVQNQSNVKCSRVLPLSQNAVPTMLLTHTNKDSWSQIIICHVLHTNCNGSMWLSIKSRKHLLKKRVAAFYQKLVLVVRCKSWYSTA